MAYNLSDVLAYHTARAHRHAKDLIRIRHNKHIYTGAELATWWQIRKDYLSKLRTHNRYKRIIKEVIRCSITKNS